MRPVLIFQDPSSLQGRQWVLTAEPPQIHDVVCTLLPPSTGFPVEIAVIRASAGTVPPGGPDDATEAAIAFVSAGISAAATTWLWRVRASTINIVSARRAGEGWPLSSLLRFLERVTTRVHVTVRGDRFPQLLRARLEDLAMDPLGAFALALTTWYLEGDGGKTNLLEEYEGVHASLRGLTNETEPIGVTLRRVVGASGPLRLGTWTCDLPRGWQRRWAMQETPNEWAEALLSIKHRTNTRTVKERLAVERRERLVRAAWKRYGRWVVEDARRAEQWPVGAVVMDPP
ncbi:MAG TPA: hypothetical protein VJX71_28070 [Methylomirabilota bacterium]|nr:hypothetical protein [Methylomirabilota bacterium]